MMKVYFDSLLFLCHASDATFDQSHSPKQEVAIVCPIDAIHFGFHLDDFDGDVGRNQRFQEVVIGAIVMAGYQIANIFRIHRQQIHV